MQDLFAYTSFLDFWTKSMPETPFGRSVHEKPQLLFDKEQLEKIYDRTDTLLVLLRELQDDPARLSLISAHLKRLPRFPAQEQQVFDEIELFQIKKFLHNYHALMQQLPDSVQKTFGFDYRSRSLEEHLNLGRQSAETFYIADEYSPELANVRAEILETDSVRQSLEIQRLNEIKEHYGLDFQGRPFLLVPKEKLLSCNTAPLLLSIEPYDDTMFSVYPAKSAMALELAEKRQQLAQQERICEEAVLKSIATEVRNELPNLLKYLDAALTFDLAWGRARMARELSLTRPHLHTKNSIHISGGRFTPCESLCEKHGVPYTPLDANFESGATVIFGSNMGGKTIVLQTTALLQLAAQTGLFVPAERFETRIFHTLHYIGEHSQASQTDHQGLSGFAMEMRQLMYAWQNIKADKNGTLLLMDEFARTTSSTEAEAILAAVLDAISQKCNTLALCSTHFHGLQRTNNIRFLRMAGLEQKNMQSASGASGNDTIAEIARCMTYCLITDDGKQTSDAIAVAQLLGLDSELVQRAAAFFYRQST